MKPGLELDILIAKNVSDWRSIEPKKCDGMLGELPGGGCTCECGWVGQWGDEHLDERGSTPKPYSTEISAAWQVVEFLNRKGFNICLAARFDGQYACFITNKNQDQGSGPYSTSMAFSICVAALEVMGVKVE